MGYYNQTAQGIWWISIIVALTIINLPEMQEKKEGLYHVVLVTIVFHNLDPYKCHLLIEVENCESNRDLYVLTNQLFKN